MRDCDLATTYIGDRADRFRDGLYVGIGTYPDDSRLAEWQLSGPLDPTYDPSPGQEMARRRPRRGSLLFGDAPTQRSCSGAVR